MQKINRNIPHDNQFFSEFLELQKYSNDTDSVFIGLFAYFDESMSSIAGYEA